MCTCFAFQSAIHFSTHDIIPKSISIHLAFQPLRSQLFFNRMYSLFYLFANPVFALVCARFFFKLHFVILRVQNFFRQAMHLHFCHTDCFAFNLTSISLLSYSIRKKNNRASNTNDAHKFIAFLQDIKRNSFDFGVKLFVLLINVRECECMAQHFFLSLSIFLSFSFLIQLNKG